MEESKVVIDVNPEATTSEPKYIQMLVQKEDRKFVFLIPDGSKIGEAYDAAFEILQKISDLGKEAVEKAKPVDAPVAECSPEACTE